MREFYGDDIKKFSKRWVFAGTELRPHCCFHGYFNGHDHCPACIESINKQEDVVIEAKLRNLQPSALKELPRVHPNCGHVLWDGMTICMTCLHATRGGFAVPSPSNWNKACDAVIEEAIRYYYPEHHGLPTMAEVINRFSPTTKENTVCTCNNQQPRPIPVINILNTLHHNIINKLNDAKNKLVDEDKVEMESRAALAKKLTNPEWNIADLDLNEELKDIEAKLRNKATAKFDTSPYNALISKIEKFRLRIEIKGDECVRDAALALAEEVESLK